jgi:type IX secretion system substrate protein/galactose oxidase-like protein
MKTKLFFLSFFFTSIFSILNCFSQAGEWVWLKGGNTPGQPATFGVQGIPGPANTPAALYEPCEWTDLNGNFWLFGGSHGVYNGDLWKYVPVTNEWTWMKGSGIPNDPGNYGIQGIPSPSNNPPAKGYGIASWTDTLGNLWMFGGGGTIIHNDLWKYEIGTNEWTWMKGSNIASQTGVYGTQGIADTGNYPGFRWEAVATWTDNSGDLWLFGGYSGGRFSDLWKYHIASNQWAWMKGSQIMNELVNYGTIGIEDSLNTPGGRSSYSRWKDKQGNLWLFAGVKASSTPFNDLWRYNPITNNWTWMGGSMTTNAQGFYGTKCVPFSGNVPGVRYENRACWTDQNGNFWAFGGGTGSSFSPIWNDLWVYCVETNQWIWQSGDSISNPAGNWGTQGVSGPANKPNGRGGNIAWKNNNDNLYFFGGSTSGFPTLYNDIWKYVIDTSCAICPVSTSLQEMHYPSNYIEIHPNPAGSYFELIIGECGINNKAKLSITDASGKRVYQTEIKTQKSEIYPGHINNGIYIVTVYMQQQVFQKKLVVNH